MSTQPEFIARHSSFVFLPILAAVLAMSAYFFYVAVTPGRHFVAAVGVMGLILFATGVAKWRLEHIEVYLDRLVHKSLFRKVTVLASDVESATIPVWHTIVVKTRSSRPLQLPAAVQHRERLVATLLVWEAVNQNARRHRDRSDSDPQAHL